MTAGRMAGRHRNRLMTTGTENIMSESRKDVLLKALQAEIGGAPDDPRDTVHRGRGGLVAHRHSIVGWQHSPTWPPVVKKRSPTRS